jgi:hypothetical protein
VLEPIIVENRLWWHHKCSTVAVDEVPIRGGVMAGINDFGTHDFAQRPIADVLPDEGGLGADSASERAENREDLLYGLWVNKIMSDANINISSDKRQ